MSGSSNLNISRVPTHSKIWLVERGWVLKFHNNKQVIFAFFLIFDKHDTINCINYMQRI